MLIKALWNNALAAKAQLSKQSSFASLLNTNIPMGNKKGASLTRGSASFALIPGLFFQVVLVGAKSTSVPASSSLFWSNFMK